MKFKKIPAEYLSTILDRLMRLEPAKVRYNRVINDLIAKFVITNRKDYSILDKLDIVTGLIDYSFLYCKNSLKINQLFLDLEKRYFIEDELSYQYLSNRFNFDALINNFEVSNETPKNVLWLKNIHNNFDNFDDIKRIRISKSLLYPIEKIILCEGQTEYVLLATLLNLLGFNLYKEGILVIPAGGKNQVAKKFYEMVEYIKIPIFILLDNDAKEISEIIEPKLRNIDKMYLIKNGEFEDILPLKVLENTINNIHNTEYNCKQEDFLTDCCMVKNIENIYRNYGFGEFKKAHFAQELRLYINSNCSKEDFENSEINEILSSLQDF